MTIKKEFKIRNFIEKKLKSNENKKFKKGQSSIPLAVPPYDTDEILEALDSLLSKQTTMGTKVKKFEKKFSEYIKNKYSLMVNSGSSANLLSLSILSNPLLGKKQIKPNDEIITPAVTWATTVYPIVNIGAIPKFVDVRLNDFNIDETKIENSITKKTKAIMIVHLLGNPCNIDKIKKIAKKYNLWLIEDSCEAHGAKFKNKHVGTFGDISTFSFFASHHITTMEGGMVCTNNKLLYDLGKSMRTFGWARELPNKNKIETENPNIDPRFLFVNMGFNFRPTELQGAFGIHQIKRLENLVKIRIKNAQYWNKKLEPLEKYLLLPAKNHQKRNSFLFYPITVVENQYFSKTELVAYLEKNHIETRPIMTGNMVEQPVSKNFTYKNNHKLKNSHYITKNSFAIGNHHKMTEEMKKFIVDTIYDFISLKTKNS